MTQAFLLIAVGIVALVAGADFMVRGASRLAVTMGLSTLFVGLTVVAFATSAPELVVCVRSSLAGLPDLAVGNVVGSNLCNICVILGLTAVVTPIRCARSVVFREVPIGIAVTLTFWWFARGGIQRFEAGIMVATLLAYIARSYFSMRAAGVEDSPDVEKPPASGGLAARLGRDLAFIAIGLAGLNYGSKWLVTGATEVATFYGLSPAVIGLTVVAVGTSLPEVATSVLAALKKDPDLAVGNVMGSNLWNLLAVAGISGVVVDLPVEQQFIRFDIPVVLGLTVLLFPVMRTGFKISRAEGALFLLLYAGYVVVRLRYLGD